MTQQERLHFLIEYLIKEDPQYSDLEIPDSEPAQKRLFRSLMNIRAPKPIGKIFTDIQDGYLLEERRKKGTIALSDLSPLEKGIYLWQGDITSLQTDAIVNAANSALLGCFVPCHGCIDNAIHSSAGIQLRSECASLMEKQGYPEPAGTAKITKAYNLPCRYILHTVGPIIRDEVTKKDRMLLASCYRSCLELAAASGFGSIAFCCISTGEFHFPNEAAARIAIDTVRNFMQKHPSGLEVIFNVFQEKDYIIYRQLLQPDAAADEALTRI